MRQREGQKPERLASCQHILVKTVKSTMNSPARAQVSVKELKIMPSIAV
jgi:hypothetical protein